jgi:pyruvate dehydrogenase E2 component (dihydrolipoamide acetyltransferase)
MAYEFRLPDIGEGLMEAEIVEWRVAVGDTVSMDQIVVDVETDKAVVEIPIPVAGTVLYLAEAEVVEVGAVLVVIGEEGEVWPPETEPAPTSGDAAPIVGTLDTEVTTLPSRQVSSEAPLALPVVRKLAKEMGVDLTTVRGTGPQGRVTRDDVMAAAGHPQEPDAPGPSGGRPLSRIRRAVAEHMTRSWTEIPHVTTFGEVDATRLLEVKKALTRRSGVTISMDALVAKGVVPALRAFPDFNALAKAFPAQELDNAIL